MILVIVGVIFIIRLVFLKVSKQNEARILAEGGTEYGKENTKRLTILHILFYLASCIEAVLGHVRLDIIGMVGVALLVFALVMLYTVVRLLKGIWTVKLMIAKKHQFNNHWLFRTIKHPNYFLNIFPELLGLALLCHAWWTLVFVGPLYAYTLFIRIQEENELIQTLILPNGIK